VYDLSNRERLLVLKDLFFQKTDENHYKSVEEILEILQTEMGNTTNYKTLKTDISALNSLGFEVLEDTQIKGKTKKYAHVDREFEPYEVQMLVDAVASSRFIGKSDSKHLTSKLKRLLSDEQGKKIKTELIINPLAKSNVKNFHLYVSRLHEAIAGQHFVQFQYGDFDWNKHFNLKRQGEFYTVEPIGVVWQESYYYLIAFIGEETYPRNFRIDRMRNVESLSRTFEDRRFDLNPYISGSLNMFGAGEYIQLTLKCKHSVMKNMVDEFGSEFLSRKFDEDYCTIKVTAKDNSGLVYWLMKWGSSVEVLKPDHIREAVHLEFKNALRTYEKEQ
jgi:predicted DNA-binding transcriptional regulator YafY